MIHSPSNHLLLISLLAVSAACLLHAGDATVRARILDIPTLDEMSGEWTPMDDIANPPSLHNGQYMMIVDRDLTSYFFSPGGWLYNLAAYGDAKEPTIWKRGHPAVKLKLDGVEYPAREAKYSNYRALRRNNHCNGLAVLSDTRLVNESRGVLSRTTFTNTTLLPRKFRASFSMAGSLQPDGIGVANTFQRAGAVSVIRPVTKPDSVAIDAYIVAIWNYDIELAPGASTSLAFASGDEPVAVAGTDGFIQGDIGNAKGDAAEAQVRGWVSHFDKVFETCREVRETRWADAFTPGNSHFSGHLPVLKTDDAALKRNYYMGILTLLALERSQFPVHPRSFVTNGERDDGTQFQTDMAVLPAVWALLEPDGMKATLRRWLVQNVRNGAWIDLRQTSGFDSKHYERMMGYAYNACFFLRTVDRYLRVTGDLGFLDEKLENGQTVFERMDAIATDWETLPLLAGGLRDFGGNESLLECAPAYTHGVASMNAQGVWMLRTLAGWCEHRGLTDRAAELRKRADAFVPQVMKLYQAGEGVWTACQPDGRMVEFRHCIDYVFAGDALSNDLTDLQKREMNAFVKTELFTRDWMRAMSRLDPSAHITNRNDHGPGGSYDPWIPLTLRTMWSLGDPQAAFDFYRRTAVVTREGPFTQAHEFYGPARESANAPVRISSERGNMREATGGAAFSEVVLESFFGFAPDVSGINLITDPATPRPFTGELHHLSFRGKEITLHADPHGVTIR